MTNVEAKRVGDKLILTIDISEAARKSAWRKDGGKLFMIATTSGVTSIEGVQVSVNAGFKAAPQPA